MAKKWLGFSIYDHLNISTIEKVNNDGKVVSCNDFLDSYLSNSDFEKNFDNWADKFFKSSTTIIEVPEGSFFTEKNFYPALFNDLKSAKNEIIIFSPFITVTGLMQFI